MVASRFLRNFYLSALVILALFLSTAASAQTALTTIAAGNTPIAVAVNTVTNKAYVVNRVGNSVTVIDGATNATATVTVGSGPKAIAVNPLTNKIYVANGGSGTVTVIDGATNTTSTVTVGTIPDGVAVNPVTNKIYVTNAGSGTVTVIDGATNGTASVSAGVDPYAVAVNTVTNKIYVSHYSTVKTVNTVTVIDGATNDTATVTTGTNPFALGVNEVTNKIYVANLSGGVTVIDGATNSTSTVTAGTYPYAVGVNPVTNKIYVANEGSANVTEIDGATNTTATVTVGTDPQSLTVNPLTNQVFVGNYGGTVTAINGVTSTTVTVTAGTNPAAIAVNPVTNQVYVANGGSANVTVVDGASNNPTTVNVSPEAIAVNPVTGKFYAADEAHSVKVIDGTTYAVTSITVGRTPITEAANPATNKIYAANLDDGTVSVIDGATNTVTATVTVGSWPKSIAVNTITNKIYVANFLSNTVTVIDGATNGTATVATGTRPDAVAVNPVTNKIYVANDIGGTVTVIDGITNTPMSVTAGSQNGAIAVNAATNKIYVAGYLTSAVIDGATNAVTNVVTLEAEHVSVNALTNKIYFAGEQHAWVMDGATNHTMFVADDLPYISAASVLANPATNDVYIGNGQNQTIAIDGATNSHSTLTLGGGPAVAIDPATNQIAMGNVGYTTTSFFRASEAQHVPVTIVVNGVVDSYTLSGLQLFATANASPAFTAQVTSNFSPSTPAPTALYYQLDTLKGAWMAATETSGVGTNPAMFNFSLSNVVVGIHTVYVYAAGGNESSSVGSFTFEVVGITPATMVSPTPGSTLTGSSAMFSWSAGANVTQYSLYLGTTPGAHDVAYVNAGTSLSTTVNGIPTNANALYVTLYSLINGKYYANAYTYTEAGTPAAATMTSPTPGSTLTGASATFAWTAGSGVSNYSLYVGTTLGARDVAYVNAGKNTSTVVTGIPTSGGTLYVTLYSLINGTYQSHAYTYVEAGTASKATMVSPANGSTLHGLSQTFTWTAGAGVTSYSLYVGTTVGAHDLDYVPTTGTSKTIGNLPAINTTIYVRLYSLIAGSWQYADYSYVSAP